VKNIKPDCFHESSLITKLILQVVMKGLYNRSKISFITLIMFQNGSLYPSIHHFLSGAALISSSSDAVMVLSSSPSTLRHLTSVSSIYIAHNNELCIAPTEAIA
jgi:hypothetical protein